MIDAPQCGPREEIIDDRGRVIEARGIELRETN